MCEVYPDKQCVWVRAYRRLAYHGKCFSDECVPPRMWELNKTNSWLNFHLKRDHQSADADQIGLKMPSGDKEEKKLKN